MKRKASEHPAEANPPVSRKKAVATLGILDLKDEILARVNTLLCHQPEHPARAVVDNLCFSLVCKRFYAASSDEDREDPDLDYIGCDFRSGDGWIGECCLICKGETLSWYKFIPRTFEWICKDCLEDRQRRVQNLACHRILDEKHDYCFECNCSPKGCHLCDY